MTRFVDRSNVNGSDDYGAASVTHLYLKATEGVSFVDATYQSRRAQALSQGVKHVGAYHFADLADPNVEAAHFCQTIGKPRPEDLRPCLDLERGAVVSDVAWAEAFCKKVHYNLGIWPAIYGSTSLLAPMRNESKLLRSLAWWRAEYGANDGFPHPLAGGTLGAAAHQYTSVARFHGLSGDVDASILLDAHHLIVQPRYEIIITAGTTRLVVKEGHLWRTRGAAKVLGLLKDGHKKITVKVVDQ